MIGLASSLRKQADACGRLGDDIQAIDLYKRADMFNSHLKQNAVFDAYAYMILDLEAQISAERAELCRKTKHDKLAMQYTIEADKRWRRLAELPAKSMSAPSPSGQLAIIIYHATRRTKEQSTLFEATAPGLVATLERLAYEYCHAGMYGEAELLFGRIMEIFNRVAEYNKRLQLDRLEFAVALYKDWHACHQAVPPLVEDRMHVVGKVETKPPGGARKDLVDNPYLTEFRSLKHRQDRFEERPRLWQKFGRAIPTNHALMVLREYQPLIVLGPKVDYWMAMLRKAKVDAISLTVSEEQSAVRIARAIEKTGLKPQRTLVICSPPAGSSIASNALASYAGKTLIFIGQPAGFFGDDNAFFQLLSKDWKLRSLSPLPQWPEVYDVVSVYERKATTDVKLVRPAQ